MRLLVVLASIVLAIHADTDKELFLEFKQTYGRSYRNLREQHQRFAIFQDNIRSMDAHNKKYMSGEKSYYMGINRFSDMTAEEFKSMLNYSAAFRPTRQQAPVYHVESGLEAPTSVNWVSKGVVSEVKNQGNCGSCWAFSATGSVEGAYALNTGSLVSFSEQNLMDCSTVNGGCDGGWMQAAFEYIRDNGIESETDYPYQAVQGACQFTRSKSVTRVSGFVNVAQSESALLDAVAYVGPISVAINAAHFQNFAGGIFSEDSCDVDDLNHGVLAVGYGSQNGVDYWLVKNSWGVEWGESGYFKMIRGRNQCGIDLDASYPTL